MNPAPEIPAADIARVDGGAAHVGRARWMGVVRRIVPFAALIVLIIFFSIAGGTAFLSYNNALFLIQQSAIIAIPAYGTTMVILAGSIDLSVGSNIGLSGMVAALVATSHGVVAGMVAGVLAGVTLGLLNGIGFAVLRVPSFIVTLATLSIAEGVTLVLSQSQPVSAPLGFQGIGQLPGIIVLFAACTVGCVIVLHLTSFGRRAVAIGGQERVAWLSGVRVVRMKIYLFMFAGLMAGLGGIALTARVGSATPDAAQGFELTAITAVVLGGTPLTGGVGNMFNTLVGAFILSILLNGMIILGLSDDAQLIAQGLVLVAAVLLSLDRSKLSMIK